MESQKRLIHENDWDVLIILDACRYDYFAEVYEDYLGGNLRKVKSPATATVEWLKEVFPQSKQLKDTIYVSANPLISLPKLTGFDAEKIFFEVLDIWESEWAVRDTVRPEEVGKKSRLIRAKYPGKKIIIHFIQPHYPYLEYNEPTRDVLIHSRDGILNKMRAILGNSTFLDLVRDKISKAKLNGVRKFFMERNSNPSEELTKTGGSSRLKGIAKIEGLDGLRNLYKRNLKIALEEVKRLRRMPGNLVVTADHGELLGENGLFAHSIEHPLVREVPWLEIE